MPQNTQNNNNSRVITIPNILSLFRIVLIPFIVWLYYDRKEYLLVGLVFILSAATDIVDGFIARHYNAVSDLGKILDPFADKLTQATLLVCLIPSFPLMLLPFSLMAVKELFMVISGYAVIKKTGAVFSAYWHGKAATCMLFLMMITHLFWHDINEIVSIILIAAASCMVALSFVFYAIHNIKALKKDKQNKE